MNVGFKTETVNFVAAGKVLVRVSMESVQSPCPNGLMLPQSGMSSTRMPCELP